MLGGRFSRPVLKFKNGTSIYPFEGLALGLKPLKGPNKIHVKILSEKRVKGILERFIENVVGGFRNYPGLEELFHVSVETDYMLAEDIKKVEDEIPNLLGCSVAVVALPDKIKLPDMEDYYLPLKREISLLSIPSQMVEYSTLKNHAENRYVAFNFALNLYGKAGGIAWGLAEKIGNFAFIGIDVAGGFTSASLLANPLDPVIAWHVEYNPSVEVSVSLENTIYPILEKAAKSLGGKMNGFIVHRDGRTHWSEIEAVRRIYYSAIQNGLLVPDSFYALLEVRKKVTPRIIRSVGGKFYNPEKGVYAILDDKSVLLATTGYPERGIPLYHGLVRPILINLADTSDWEISVREHSKLIYWFSQLHWGSAFYSPKLPITTLYAHRICQFVSMGVFPEEDRKTSLWFL